MRPVRHAGARRCRLLRPVRQERGQALKKKGEEFKKPTALRPAASTKALYRLCRTVPGRVPVSSVRPPVLGAFGRASRSAGSAASSYYHRDRHRREPRDMGPVGRCSGLPGLRQAFPGPGGADPGYVEHRPVSGAGVPKARCRTRRTLPGICAFAPCAAHRHELSKPPYLGNASRRFTCFLMTPWTTPNMCARQHGPGMILPASRRGT